MTTTKPTPEEIENYREMVAEADAEAEAARRADNLERLAPLTALGFGPGATIKASVPDMIAAIRSARDLRDVHPDLADMADATARVLETFADRARTAIQANQPQDAPQTGAA